MRKLLTISLLSAMPVVLAGTTLVFLTGDGDGDSDGGRDTDRRPAASAEPAATPTTTSPTTTSPTTSGPAALPATSPDEPAAPPPATTDPPTPPAPPTDVRFVCPEGGMDAVTDLQHAVDDGHQPWRLSAEDVAAACTFGVPGSSVEPAGTNRYQVNHPATGESAVVDVAQPLGPGTIWVATRITLATPTAPAG